MEPGSGTESSTDSDAVSYTHLDVDKRQILFCSSMRHRTGIIIFEIAFVLFLLYKARNLLARKRYKEEITVLISYLDIWLV